MCMFMCLITYIIILYTIDVNMRGGGDLMYLNNEFGIVRFKIDDLIKAKGISKTKLSYHAELQRSQLNAYCENKVARIDLVVLGRLCTVLDCDISDILEFVPPAQKE